MKKKTDQNQSDELRPEYDFASMKGGVRGKYVSVIVPERTSFWLSQTWPRHSLLRAL